MKFRRKPEVVDSGDAIDDQIASHPLGDQAEPADPGQDVAETETPLSNSSPYVEELLGAEREAQILLERRRMQLRSAVVAEGEERLAEVRERFAAERAELERQLEETRSKAQEWVAATRESYEELGRDLERERARTGELEVQLEETADERDQAATALEQTRADLQAARDDLKAEREEARARAQETDRLLA